MKVREYAQPDKEACLAIFDSNTPSFFAPHEREEFAEFLDTSSDPYFVVEHNGQVVGCGGFFLIPNTPAAVLTWGMVARARHGRGIGRLLLEERLQRLRDLPGVRVVKLQTSQHTYGFFEKAGFRTEHVQDDGYGPGLHLYNMGMNLS